MDLTEFLLARIAEDEATARAGERADVEFPAAYIDTFGAQDWADDFAAWARHFTPARILAECEAKRRIVDEHPNEFGRCTTCGYETYDWPDGDAYTAYQAWPCDTVCLLALPYAEHPDFREEWKP